MIHFSGLLYYSVLLNTKEFAAKKETRTYENNVTKAMEKEEFERTLHYWKNNFNVGAKHLIPIAGVNYLFFSEQYSSLAEAYRFHVGGLGEMVEFMGGTFLHDIPENIGFFLLATLSLYIIIGAVSRKILTERFWRDYGIIAIIGFSLVLIAGPIEAFASPHLLTLLEQFPVIAVFLLLLTYGFYIYIFLIHFEGGEGLKKRIRAFLRVELGRSIS